MYVRSVARHAGMPKRETHNIPHIGNFWLFVTLLVSWSGVWLNPFAQASSQIAKTAQTRSGLSRMRWPPRSRKTPLTENTPLCLCVSLGPDSLAKPVSFFRGKHPRGTVTIRRCRGESSQCRSHPESVLLDFGVTREKLLLWWLMTHTCCLTPMPA